MNYIPHPHLQISECSVAKYHWLKVRRLVGRSVGEKGRKTGRSARGKKGEIERGREVRRLGREGETAKGKEMEEERDGRGEIEGREEK